MTVLRRRNAHLHPLVSGGDDEDDPVRVVQGLEHLPHHIPPLLFRLQDGSVPTQRGIHSRQLQVRPVPQHSDQVLDELSFNRKLEIIAKGAGDVNIITMILIFLVAGAFSGIVRL